MAGYDQLLSFFLATLAVAFFPGPAMLYVAAQTAASGRRGGLAAMLGVHLGGYVHVLAAAFGLWVLFRHLPAAFVGLRISGAVYLVWMGLSMWRQKPGEDAAQAPVQRRGRVFFRSMTVQILNPKVAIFFVAFLPLFTDPSASLPVAVQMLILGLVVNFCFALADTAAVLLTGKVVELARQKGTGMRILERIGGTVLIALGIRMALAPP